MTNETVLVVNGIENRYIEGIWTCRHGTSYEYAIVNITRIAFKGKWLVDRDIIKWVYTCN